MLTPRAEVDAWLSAIQQLDTGPEKREISRADQAALATPVTLAAHLSKHYKVRKHLTVVGDAIRDIYNGEGDRLQVSLPPQIGKTLSAVVWAAFWWLCKTPTAQIIIVSYNDRLAVQRGLAIRKLVEEHGHRFGLYIDPSTRAKHDWGVTTGGAVRSVGVGSTITGTPADCLAGDTRIVTPSGGKRLDDFVRGGCTEPVLSFNHATGEREWRSVEASRRIPKRDTVEVTTYAGRTIRCTPDHRIFTNNRGYTAAALLRPGDTLVTSLRKMRDMRRGDQPSQRAHSTPVPPLLGGVSAGPREPDRFMHPVWERIPEDAGRTGEGASQGVHEHVLLKDLPGRVLRNRQCSTLPDVRQGHGGGAEQTLLLRRVPQRWTNESARDCDTYGSPVPEVWARVPAQDSGCAVLHTGVRRPGSCGSHVGDRECQFQGWEELRPLVQVSATTDQGPGSSQVCGLPKARREGQVYPCWEASREVLSDGPSYRSQPGEQPPREPDNDLPALSHVSSQGGKDYVRAVRRVRTVPVDVYDLQVEGNRNFFAGEILVHNCVWIDDPHKNWEESESQVMRDKVHDAYDADISTRLAPFAPVILVQTRWNMQDLAGRRIQEEGRTEQGGRWRVLSMPAICTDPVNDPLGRKLGEPLPHPKIPEGDMDACLRHWESKRRSLTVRIWYALYQADPRPAEGALLTWDMVRSRRCYEKGNTGCAQPERIGVGVDPSGGGRDTAGIIGGYLGDDGRGYFTHDRSGVMSSDMWGRKACELAAEIDADCFVVETNYGGDQATLVLRTSWASLRRENPTRYSVFCPRIIEVKSRRGKLLRAEPIAQQVIEDRIRFGAYLPDMEAEMCSWSAESKESPGRIDAGVHLMYELLPVPESGEATFTDARQGMMDLTQGLTPGDVGLVR